MGEEDNMEQKVEEQEAGEKQVTEKKKDPPPPTTPLVLNVDLHCVGCAKKIEKSILRIRGVEELVMDMSQNQLTIKGIVDPQLVCARIMNKTKRRARVVSPLEIPQITASGLQTVKLNVNMHCDACAQQLKATLLKMRGVQTVETEFSSDKITVTGTMDANKLVEYVYRRSKKQARVIVPVQPEPAESRVESQEKEEEKLADAEKKKEKGSGKQDDEKSNEENKKEAEPEAGGDDTDNKEENEQVGEKSVEIASTDVVEDEEEHMKRRTMMYYYQHPLYIVDRIPPPPQVFSDENPNALCCIS